MLPAIRLSLHKIVADIIIWTFATPAAFVLRYDGNVPQAAYTSLLVVSLLAFSIKLVSIFLFRLYLPSWRHLSSQDVQVLAKAIAVVTLVFMAILFLAHPYMKGLPRSVPLIDGLISFVSLIGVRFSVRSWFDYKKRFGMKLKDFKRVLIVGAGETGSLVARGIQSNPEIGFKPVGFVDDGLDKISQSIAGVAVLGTLDKLVTIIDEQKIDAIIIAIPSAKGMLIRKVVHLASLAKRDVKYHIAPDIYGILSEKTPLENLREVRAEDLLRRLPIKLDLELIANYLRQKTVLITGAGGSIGSELVRQIANASPEKLILFDSSEDNIYKLEQELAQNYQYLSYLSIIGDVCNKKRLQRVFQKHIPQVVFHAAAYKHLPLMERNPEEAVFNNVIGTKYVVDTALLYGVSHLINISTDKAVNPTSVLGASKYVAECLVQEASLRAGQEQFFVSVRFGNVLDSRGSVIPLFKHQISKGGPITITHPEAKRFFMTIPEAVQLLLQAGAIGENGLIYILDMGDPVRILDLAKDLISLYGLEVDKDVNIEFSGLRPGEKLLEELTNAEEKKVNTPHEKIFVARRDHTDSSRLLEMIDKLKAAALEADAVTIRNLLNKFVAGAQLKDSKPKETVAA